MATTSSEGVCITCPATFSARAMTKDEQVAFAGFDQEAMEAKVQQTIEEHNLFSRDDQVLVACSGGKDSTVLLYILKKLGYNIEGITVNAHIGCYTEDNLKNLRQVCEKIGVKLHEISFREEFGKSLCYLQSLLKAKGYDYKNCHTCGVLRRYLLNKHSKQINPNVIATGHNLDDEAQAVMMNLFRGNVQVCARLGPKSGITKDTGKDSGKRKFVQRVKPLYFVSEQDVVAYSKTKEFPVNYGECPCSSDTYRREMKDMFRNFGQEKEKIKQGIIHSFIGIAGKMKAHFSRQKEHAVKECEICGEPSSKDICNTCGLLAKLKENKIVKTVGSCQ